MDDFKKANNRFVIGNDLNCTRRPRRSRKKLKQIANKIARNKLKELKEV